jgi:hypothetical protein
MTPSPTSIRTPKLQAHPAASDPRGAFAPQTLRLRATSCRPLDSRGVKRIRTQFHAAHLLARAVKMKEIGCNLSPSVTGSRISSRPILDDVITGHLTTRDARSVELGGRVLCLFHGAEGRAAGIGTLRRTADPRKPISLRSSCRYCSWLRFLKRGHGPSRFGSHYYAQISSRIHRVLCRLHPPASGLAVCIPLRPLLCATYADLS